MKVEYADSVQGLGSSGAGPFRSGSKMRLKENKPKISVLFEIPPGQCSTSGCNNATQIVHRGDASRKWSCH